MSYNHQKIEKKWQAYWEKKKNFKVKEDNKISSDQRLYVLDMFPYPSAEGLHVGHPEGYTATDIYCRYQRAQGKLVLHPMGWDAFGLPAENFAIKTGTNPAITIKQNIDNIRRQIKALGFSYDWSREINTTDSEYYQWTQWIFLQLFKRGLAYESNAPINFCPKDKTGLANEEVKDGKCERCGTPVIKKSIRQWILKITEYAERLEKDLELLDWPESIKILQRNWIGKSEGVQFALPLTQGEEKLSVYTTRLDTVFGMTFAVIAPEHPLVAKILANQESGIRNQAEVRKYVAESQKKSDLQRTELAKEKTGVELQGVKAINPFTKQEIPIYVGDFVLGHYGTGAVMAVPGHDTRDFEFAQKHNILIKEVIVPGPKDKAVKKLAEAFIEDGYLIDSGEFSGLTSEQARVKMADWLEKEKIGQRQVNYKLRDWIFSRQRYWGEPIPLVFCERCAEQVKSGKLKVESRGEQLNPGWVPVPEKDLPVKLPKVGKYEPSGTGESPLVNVPEWVNTKCPRCGGPAKRETNTMPQWAGSCWYYLAYTMVSKSASQRISKSAGQKYEWNKKLIDYWNPVDLYVGGAEHAVLHLLYARFWHKVLFDTGLVSTAEPFMKLKNQGMILGENGEKMSKSRGNVVNPDEVVKEYGADTFRLYEMFMGPFEDAKPWNTKSIIGVRRFLERIYNLVDKVGKKSNSGLEKILNQTIKKVGEDIENFRFNTAISQMMILVKAFQEQSDKLNKDTWQKFLIILSPFAPHLAEELWEKLGNKKSISLAQWPKYDPTLIVESEIEVVVQVNGKVRDKVTLPAEVSEEQVKVKVLASDKVQKWLENKPVKKFIYIKGRLLNIVT